MVKILVTGAGGGLGSAVVDVLRESARVGADLAPAWPGPIDVVGLARADLDIADGRAVRERVKAERPAVLVNCAAFTDVDACETQRTRAFVINADGPALLAGAAEEAGACLVHVSTDYVFDGTAGRPYREEDSPNPLSVYGASKAAGEVNVRARARELLLVRAARLFGPRGKSFVRVILDKARGAPRLELVTDVRGTPTYAPDLARAILHLLRQRRRGIFHFTNVGACNWLEWTQETLGAAGLQRELVPVTAAQFAARARRPRDSTLDCAKFDATGCARRTWQEATRELVALLRANEGATQAAGSA